MLSDEKAQNDTVVLPEGTADWAAVVRHGIETQELDYKAAQDWNALSRAGKAKFARHAMAMANTHGGYIVVGVGEDDNGNPTQFQGLTEKQLRSFDPSSVGQTINRYADPAVDFDIVRPEVDGKHYAIFAIRRFNTLPHVCSDSCGDELQQGAFYVRTPDARSRSATRASEVHNIVQRALRNQRQLLGRMLRGVLYEGRQFAEPDAEREFQRLLAESQATARKELGPRLFRRLVFLEVSAYPADFNEDSITLTAVRKAAESVVFPPLADFPFLVPDAAQAYLTNRSFLGKGVTSGEPVRHFFWQIFQSGLLHHVSSLEANTEKEGVISYPVLVQHIAAATLLVGQLFSELGHEEQLLTCSFRVTNCEGRVLAQTGGETQGDHRCFIPEILVRKRRTVADLDSDPGEHAARVIGEICERFNYSADRHIGLRQRLAKFLQSP